MREDVEFWRDEAGVPHVEGESLDDLLWGLGYVHARDRGLQISMMRVLGQGRACELLDDSEETLAHDHFFRKMNWSGHTEENIEKLEASTLTLLQSYVDGINDGLKQKFPWELKRILKMKREDWEVKDVLMLSRMVGYLTLSQSQGEVERFFVELVQAGLQETYLQELFPGLLEGVDLSLLQQVHLEERIVEPVSLWNLAAPRMMASNNWAIAGSRTASGMPILSNDPHLEANRLPNVWCEVVLQTKDQFLAGGSMPGLPGVLVGRNKDVAWGATYTFLDAQDSWIEHCRGNQYKRLNEEGQEEWHEFHIRTEVIKRKKSEDTILEFYENEHGILDGKPPEDGYKLTSRWAVSQYGYRSVEKILHMWNVTNVEEALETLGQIETSWNFVAADTNNNIGYQMSGLMPRRREGVRGFVPLPGWLPENDWQGFVPFTELPRCMNPEEGYIVTANEDLNHLGIANPITMPMGDYRSKRIQQLLAEKQDWTREDTFAMHYDLYSLQAERYMEILRPLLPDTSNGLLLKNWDLCYDLKSKGAWLFERFLKELYVEVFGRCGVGDEAVQFLTEETGIFIDFYANFDNILWKEESIWFGGIPREELFLRAAEKAMEGKPKAWKKNQKFSLNNMLLGGKVPRMFAFDRGPIHLPGGRATIHQGQLYKSGGRQTSFAPAFRMVVEMNDAKGYQSNMAGGASDRHTSKWYCSDLENWQKGIYKTVSTEAPEKKLKFP